VHARPRTKNEIHAVLQRRLQGKPPCSDLFGVKGRRWLAGLELAAEERESVDAGIRQIEFLDSEIAAVERLIAQQALNWPEIRRLMTVPGVNLICAATFIAAVGDAGRFLTSRKLVAYLGLDPKSASPGTRRRAAGGSASAARRPPAGRWSRPPGASSCSPARCTRSMTARAPGAGTARRSSRLPASSRSCSGACSPAARTTPTSSPR
jgi:transposase